MTPERITELREVPVHSVTKKMWLEVLKALEAEQTARQALEAKYEPHKLCLICGRDTPCMTEADLKPEDPGIPCTFDFSYSQLITLVRKYQDIVEDVEKERYRLKEALQPLANLAAIICRHSDSDVIWPVGWWHKDYLMTWGDARRAAKVIASLTETKDAK